MLGYRNSQGKILSIQINRQVIRLYSSLPLIPPRGIRGSSSPPLPCQGEGDDELHRLRRGSSKVVKQCEVGSIQNVIINPGFLTGFVDGEGSFLINIQKNKRLKVG